MSDQNANKDLWPSFEEVGPTRTPLTILKEVAATLGPKTKNLVEAVVGKPFPGAIEPGRFTYSLNLKAPALQGYTFVLLAISHGVELWPVRITSSVLDEIVSVDTEGAFLDVLKKILADPRTFRVIQGMIVQSMAAADIRQPGAA